MMSLTEWAVRWGIPLAAMQELCTSCIHTPSVDPSANSEARVQSEVRLEAANAEIYLFRNNVGAGKLESGNFVRFGLGNDSAPLNKMLKSGDLIGIHKRLITADMVGTVIGQFVSRECKRADWRFRGNDEEQAQARWAALINSQGGDAQIVTGAGSFAPKT